ncbi:MAG: hypothetical protein K8S99_16635, partial [Planctomycetes bacterium]|nr:hypothetical protein [Planctomycetota bacterium]
YYYNDIGDISSHLGPKPRLNNVPAPAAGGNNLLLDGSVRWCNLVGKRASVNVSGNYTGDYFPYGKDYCRNFYIGQDLYAP